MSAVPSTTVAPTDWAVDVALQLKWAMPSNAWTGEGFQQGLLKEHMQFHGISRDQLLAREKEQDDKRPYIAPRYKLPGTYGDPQAITFGWADPVQDWEG